MKRLVALVALAGAASAGAVWLSLQATPPPGVAAADSEPLPDRVSQVMRHSPRSPASLAQADRAPALKRLEATRACLHRSDCAYPNTDPHAYEFAVALDLARQARELREEFGRDPSMQEELETAARDLVQVDDGHVQEEAIRLFSLYPPRSENLQAMTEGLRNTYDPKLLAQAMTEWKRYLGTSDETLVQAALTEIVARGAQFASERASADVGDFLNERTVSGFRDALASMVPSSTAAKNLRAALEQYDRHQAGG